jgi:hypothetical protein
MATTVPLTGTKGGEVNFLVRQGADFVRILTLRDRATSNPIDITGQTFAGKVRKTADSATVAATFTCTVVSGPAGTVRIKLAAADSAAMTCDPDDAEADASTYVYDIERTDTTPEVHPVLFGNLYLWREVTR